MANNSRNILNSVHMFLSSAKLAMFLLIAILLACLTGVTIIRGDVAAKLIFNALWFNALLILLVVNVGACFFGRIWGRKISIVLFGMILFHLSFITMFLGVAYNSLFYFRGIIRLAEGETIANNNPLNYDTYIKGRFFDISRIKGDVSLVKVHIGYKVKEDDKRAAYEIAVGDEQQKTKGIIYITNKLTHNGYDYFNDKEGFTVLVDLFSRDGFHQYGALVPLQSIMQKDETYLYTTGYTYNNAVVADSIFFPSEPMKPQIGLQVTYFPSKLHEQEQRTGEVKFDVFSLKTDKLYYTDRKKIGERFFVDDFVLSAREVRYWVGMYVSHEPGKPIVLTSLWVGLIGMIITTIGRMIRGRDSAKSDNVIEDQSGSNASL